MKEHADIIKGCVPDPSLGKDEFRENALDDLFKPWKFSLRQAGAPDHSFLSKDVHHRPLPAAGIENGLGLNHQRINRAVAFLQNLFKLKHSAGASRVEHDHLAFFQMRGQIACNIFMNMGGCRADDKIGPFNRACKVHRHQIDLRLTDTLDISLKGDGIIVFNNRRQLALDHVIQADLTTQHLQVRRYRGPGISSPYHCESVHYRLLDLMNV